MKQTPSLAPAPFEGVQLVITSILPFECDVAELKSLVADLKKRPVWGLTWYAPIKGEPLRFCTAHAGPVNPTHDWVLDKMLGAKIRRRIGKPFWEYEEVVVGDYDFEYEYEEGEDDEAFYSVAGKR